MELEVNAYADIQRAGDWSHGLYVWLPERELSFGRAKAGIFQLHFVHDSKATSLKEVVDFYVTQMQNFPDAYGPGKYNVRVLVDFDTRLTVTVKLS